MSVAFFAFDMLGADFPPITPGASLTHSVLTQGTVTTPVTASQATASVTLVAGRSYLVLLSMTYDNTSVNLPTLSGAGQTWGAGEGANGNSNYRVQTWRIDCTTGGSGALTFALAGADQFSSMAWQVIELTPPGGFTISAGALVAGAQISGTSVSETGVSVGANGKIVSVTTSMGDMTFSSLAYTGRAGWTAVQTTIASNGGFGASLHTQISPTGGDSAASATMTPIGPFRMLQFPVTLTASGGSLTANLASTDQPDTSAAALSSFHTTALASTDAPDTSAATITARHTASLASSDTPDSSAAMLAAVHTAALVSTDAPDTSAMAISNPLGAALASTDIPDTSAANLTVGNVASAALASTDTPDTASMVVTAAHTAALASTDTPDTSAAGIAARHTATLASTDAPDTSAANVTAAHTAAMTSGDLPDTSAMNVAVIGLVSLALASTDAPDTTSATLTVVQGATLPRALAGQKTSAAGIFRPTGLGQTRSKTGVR